jgi:hypothetical protein
MANRNFSSGGKLYSMHAKPVLVDCSFVVDSANVNGLGIRALKGSGMIKNVFMHTSATAGKNNGQTNPNPASGYCVIQFQDNYQRYLSIFSGFGGKVTSPTTPVTSGLTVGNIYVITALGTTTTAEWQSIGLQSNITPAVNVSFVASATGTGGAHTGKVGLPSISTINDIEVVGDPNQTMAPNPTVSGPGGYMILQFLASTNSSTTTLIPTAPVDGSVCGLSFYFDDSSVLPGDGA